jgi:hypothetical protein
VSADLANALAEALSSAADREQARALVRELAPLDAELRAVEAELEAAGDGDEDELGARRSALEQVRLDRLAQARARLEVVSPASSAGAARSPQPVRDAAFAGLLAMILLGERLLCSPPGAAASTAATRCRTSARGPECPPSAWAPTT